MCEWIKDEEEKLAMTPPDEVQEGISSIVRSSVEAGVPSALTTMVQKPVCQNHPESRDSPQKYQPLPASFASRRQWMRDRVTQTCDNPLCARLVRYEKLIAQGSEAPKIEIPKSLNKAEFPIKAPRRLEGIISYLTKKHGGNVHEKGIVTITSKSVCDDPRYALKNVADLTSGCSFRSKDEPGQWVCWDFREMRVQPTHYTIDAGFLKSWVVEGSLDGKSWTEIDQQTNNQDFKDWETASFAVSRPVECRFIRLTQTDENHDDDDSLDNDGRNELRLYDVEFFGTLSE
jgi:hypothetical protein